MTVFGIAAIQSTPSMNGGLDSLFQDIRNTVKRLPWVQMVVLGELAAHGPKTDHAEPSNGETEQRFRDLARELEIYLVPGSLYEKRADGIYNTTPVIDPQGEVIARHDKLFPFLPYETGVTPGRDYCVFDIPQVGRFGVVICYDMWFPEVVRTLAGMGAEVILIPTMTNTVDRDVELSIARANAAVNQCYVIDVNVAGDWGNGRSVFYGPGGELLYECGDGHDVVALELNLDEVRRVRERGWNGLGQVLKSFRDSDLSFPLHEDPAERRRSMKKLGELKKPGKGGSSAQSRNDAAGPVFRVIE